MRLNEIAAEIHRWMCEDDRFGYSWEERYGAVWETWMIDGTLSSMRFGISLWNFVGGKDATWSSSNAGCMYFHIDIAGPLGCVYGRIDSRIVTLVDGLLRHCQTEVIAHSIIHSIIGAHRVTACIID